MWITSAQNVVNGMQEMMVFALDAEKKETGEMRITTMVMTKIQKAPSTIHIQLGAVRRSERFHVMYVGDLGEFLLFSNVNNPLSLFFTSSFVLK